MKTKFLAAIALGLLLSTPSTLLYAQNWFRNDKNEDSSCLMDNNYGKNQQGSKYSKHENKHKRKGNKGKRNQIASLLENNAEINAKINQIKEKDSRLLQSFNHDIKMQLKQFRMLLHDNKESTDIEQTLVSLVNNELDSLILSISYRENPTETTKDQLKNLLEKSFALKENLHKKHIQSVKARTAQLEEMLAKRKEHKSEIIEMRLSKLTETKKDTFQW